ncbi:MAG: tetratricopeptide repeat protein [Kiloniellales bacterium]
MTLRSLWTGLAGTTAIAGALSLMAGAAFGQSFCGNGQKGMGPFLTSSIGQWQTAALTDEAPPLWDNLGDLHYPVTTSSPEAQAYFDQGLRLAYGFNHAEARRAFRHAQRLDRDCALCYWGEALVLGPNINAPMSPDALGPALLALGKAKEAAHASAKERALIDALAARYSSDPQAERPALDMAYAEAMVAVAAHFPDDLDIAVLTAEALMDTQPWDYWAFNDDGSTTAKGRTEEMIALLEEVLEASPDHPGAIHLYIHMVEASDAPERAEPYADRLAAQMPGAGHIVHMPSHIYVRVGRYVDSIKANKDAVVADEAFFAEVEDESIYRGGYYPHNVHFVLTSAQMAGDGETTIEFAEKLAGVIDDEIASTVAWVQPIKAAPYFAHAQYSDPDSVLALADPGDRFPYIKGAWHYARGVAYAAKGEAKLATDEANAVYEIATNADLSFMVENYVPGDQLLEIAHHVVLGRIAQQQADFDGAVEQFKKAALIEDLMPYMEPPFWYYPVRQSLGAALLQAGRPEAAAEAFEASLKRVPNNGWALYGLSEAQKAMGDAAGAKASEAALAQAWIGPRDLLELSKL